MEFFYWNLFASKCKLYVKPIAALFVICNLYIFLPRYRYSWIEKNYCILFKSVLDNSKIKEYFSATVYVTTSIEAYLTASMLFTFSLLKITNLWNVFLNTLREYYIIIYMQVLFKNAFIKRKFY